MLTTVLSRYCQLSKTIVLVLSDVEDSVELVLSDVDNSVVLVLSNVKDCCPGIVRC